ncbi:glycosyl hydrolase family 8 [Enterovibrio sp. ZSDZ35]|uniref:Glucanase n=1 Tax=Enterovibrio qingdaonensis TaxID=2899818 RepID=A0ABT5QFR7_9GAMM|nr:glycosyl hydrolase family 8 [Enterovibrio sp. ZSDZ35]MDD1779826.1 glycosyl hydrolase family 8 [Enterovibrio sp. ZSDZ35]
MKYSLMCAAMLAAMTSNAVHANAQCDRNDWMWASFKQSFVTSEGRVVDTANKRISHSEGQGYGMLMAVHYEDKAMFSKLWSWTERHLQREVDSLFSWKWQPQKPHIPDKNNASDGDVLIAWALMRAHSQWPRLGYNAKAKNIVRDLQTSHMRRVNGETVLLPGTHGFSFGDRTIVNPGYWVYPALASFSKYDKVWNALSDSGLSILSKNLYGDAKLTPDWLQYSAKGWQPANSFPSQFSYSNYRIPLYMVWGNKSHPLNRNFTRWIGKDNAAWIDVISGEKANYPPPAGARAIAQLVAMANGTRSVDQGISITPQGKDYYSDSLVLLSHMAYKERVCK